MTLEEAKKYFEYRYNRAKDCTDVHWESDERHEHQEYVEALQIAVKALEENTELKCLLRLAVEDFDFIYREHSCSTTECSDDCPYNDEKDCCLGKWKHHDEALKLIGGEENA